MSIDNFSMDHLVLRQDSSNGSGKGAIKVDILDSEAFQHGSADNILDLEKRPTSVKGMISRTNTVKTAGYCLADMSKSEAE